MYTLVYYLATHLPIQESKVDLFNPSFWPNYGSELEREQLAVGKDFS
jgi:hypothetical protein